MHLAVSGDHYDVVKYFLDEKVDVNATTKAGHSALYFAIQRNNIPVTELLLNSGANVNIGNNGLSSPISAAMKNGNLAIIKLLLSRGATPNINPAGLSTWKKILDDTHMDILKLLVEHGLDLNCPAADGRTPLMQYVASNASLDTIKNFLSMRTQININWQSPKSKRKSHGGISALHIAVQNKSLAMVRFLIELGATVDLQNEMGVTPLHMATWSGQNDIIQLLLDNNANPMLQVKSLNYLKSCFPTPKQLDITKMTFTAFHIACFQGLLEAMKILTPPMDITENPQDFYQVGIDLACLIDCDDNLNYILGLPQVQGMLKFGVFMDFINYRLRQCVFKGMVSAAESLLIHGADPNYAAPNKASVLCEACQFRDFALVKLLLEHGANPNTSYFGGLSPLYWSINRDDTPVEIIQILLEYGANPLAMRDDGSNLIHACARAAATHLIPLFINLGVDSHALNNHLRDIGKF
ncbi:hypothetical protein THRCLA_08736 [Thraustotheca clavata]|uniref:Uncharacterized protein n=1 Tax=Thraustotheca clavata TaxID=74557 RepID=A0A1V9Z2R1_9STRA|nr:hypothetical protein THRCLA_08736 [Thraustotheca clavata]